MKGQFFDQVTEEHIISYAPHPLNPNSATQDQERQPSDQCIGLFRRNPRLHDTPGLGAAKGVVGARSVLNERK